MRNFIQKVLLILGLLISTFVMPSQTFPNQEPMGGQEFGHSDKHIHFTLVYILTVFRDKKERNELFPMQAATDELTFC